MLSNSEQHLRSWLAVLLGVGIAIAPATAQTTGAKGPSVAQATNATGLAPGHFVDVTAKSGIEFLHQAPHTSRKYLIETMGSGVALFDYDNDGRLDLFLVNGAPLQRSHAAGHDSAEDRPGILEPACTTRRATEPLKT